MNLARLLSETAARNPGKPAVVFEGTPCTYGAFDREVERYAAMLHAAGVGKGDRLSDAPAGFRRSWPAGGYNVYPKEIENVLEAHEAVKESAVVGLPDEEFGEKVVAMVVQKEGSAPVPPETFVAHCKMHLASYKCPRQVFIVRDLPRNAMGKIRKNRIVESLRDGKPF